jgi:hypothetical protein
MNLPRSLIFTVVLLVGFAGCVSTSDMMQSWVGHHRSELIASLGPPQATAPDGQGGTVLVYQSYVNLGFREGQVIPKGGRGGYSYTPPQQGGYTRLRMFCVDSNDTIYSWRWQGP